MAVNQTGIAITIKAFLPTGKTLDETFAALSIVKAAHETSDYSALLAAAIVDEVKTEQKTRRVEVKEEPQPEPSQDPDFAELPGTAPVELTTEEIAVAEAGPVEAFNHDWAVPAEEALPFDTAPEQQPKRTSKKANGNE